MSETKATIRDVARRAGVSVATISRYLNQNAPIAPETAERVRIAMHDLAYVPHPAARSLATNRKYTIGLALSTIQGDFFTPMLKGIEGVVTAEHFGLLIATPQPIQSSPAPLGPHNTDGMLVFLDGLDTALIRQYYQEHFPVVLIHQSAPNGMVIPSVTIENKSASSQLVSHLIEVHGRRRIAFLRGPDGNEDSYWREMGYRQALERHGLSIDSGLIATGDFDRSRADPATRQLLAEHPDVDAIFASDDESAVGAMSAVRAAGRRIPEDISVVGFDDQFLALYTDPPLTTIKAPTEEVGRTAARQLIQLIRNGEAASLVLLPSKVIIRSSCGCQNPAHS
jgi:DNA-binding LacI/PurR family transcriptional regulator